MQNSPSTRIKRTLFWVITFFISIVLGAGTILARTSPGNTQTVKNNVNVKSNTGTLSTKTSVTVSTAKTTTSGEDCFTLQPILRLRIQSGNASRTNYNKPTDHQCVQFFKQKLNDLKLATPPINADNTIDETFKTAVTNFQKNQKDYYGKPLVADGVVSYTTWVALRELVNPGTPTPTAGSLPAGIKPDDVNYIKEHSKIDKECIKTYKFGEKGECIKKIQELLGIPEPSDQFDIRMQGALTQFHKSNTDLSGRWLPYDGKVITTLGLAALGKLTSGEKYNKPTGFLTKEQLNSLNEVQKTKIGKAYVAKKHRSTSKSGKAKPSHPKPKSSSGGGGGSGGGKSSGSSGKSSSGGKSKQTGSGGKSSSSNSSPSPSSGSSSGGSTSFFAIDKKQISQSSQPSKKNTKTNSSTDNTYNMGGGGFNFLGSTSW